MIGHVFYGIFILILFFLALSHWSQLNGLMTTGGGQVNQYTRTLQGQ